MRLNRTIYMKSYIVLVKLTACVLLLMFGACTNTRKSVYFSDVKNNEYTTNLQSLEPVIQPNDLLHISVSSLNPEASQLFNALNENAIRQSTAANNITQAVGYLVDQDGYIQFPILGNIKAAGLTKKELKNVISQEIETRKLLMNPIVDIRYLNYKVSVLGEVQHPMVLTVPNEKITLLEALGLAGDLTLYAKRDNVLLIREEEVGKKTLHRIDLTTDELFTSPFYYLKSNDIIYVEPNKTRIAGASAARQWLPIVLSALTLVVISVDRLTR